MAMYASYTVFTSGTASKCGCVWITLSATPGFCVSRMSIARACSVALGCDGAGGNATGFAGPGGADTPKPGAPPGGAPACGFRPPPKKEGAPGAPKLGPAGGAGGAGGGDAFTAVALEARAAEHTL